MKSIFKFSIFGIFCIVPFVNIFSQHYELNIQAKDSSDIKIITTISYNKIHLSKQSALIEVDSISERFTKKGYINNQYKITENDSIINCFFTLYQKIELIRINYDAKIIDKDFINQITLTATDTYFDIPLNSTEETLNEIVSYFENQGYSFTNVFLSNLDQSNDLLSANLNIQISNKRNIDHVVIKGYPEFPKKYLKHYLEINPNTPFNLESLNKLDELISTIPFVTQIKKPEVLFTKDSTTLYIYVKKKATSNFDGILGFSNEDDSGKLKFTGYLDLQLNNVLNKGESFSINWQNSQQKNTTLKLDFNSPYIFNSKVNLNGAFSIFRQDSLFLNTKGLLTLGYSLNKNNSIQLIGTTEKSDLSSTSPTTYNLENFQKNMLGVSYWFRIIEEPIYFNRYRFSIDAGYLIGNRKSTDLKTQQNNIQFTVAYTAHFNRRNALFIKTKTEILNTTNPFDNELYRIGGVNSIRGFNENSIPTSKYNVSNLEYHYKLSNNSYIYSITDFAILNNTNTNTTTQLYGFGLGFYLNTKHTILNLSYALGKNYNIPFNANDSKIHIKITYPF